MGKDADGAAPDTPEREPDGAKVDGEGTGKSDTPDLAKVAEERYKEVQAAFTRASMENAELKGRLAQIEAQAVKADNPREKGETAAEYEGRVKSILESISKATDPERERFNLMRAMVLDGTDAIRKDLLAEMKELKSQLELVDPEYVSNKAAVDQMMKEVAGLTRQQAKAIIKMQADKGNENGKDKGRSSRAQIPGSPRSNGSAGNEDEGEALTALPPDVEAKIKAMEMSKESTARIRKSMLDELNGKKVRRA